MDWMVRIITQKKKKKKKCYLILAILKKHDSNYILSRFDQNDSIYNNSNPIYYK